MQGDQQCQAVAPCSGQCPFLGLFPLYRVPLSSLPVFPLTSLGACAWSKGPLTQTQPLLCAWPQAGSRGRGRSESLRLLGERSLTQQGRCQGQTGHTTGLSPSTQRKAKPCEPRRPGPPQAPLPVVFSSHACCEVSLLISRLFSSDAEPQTLSPCLCCSMAPSGGLLST